MIKYFLYNVDSRSAVTKTVEKYTQLITIQKQLEDLGQKVEVGGVIFNKEGIVTGIDPDNAIPMEPEYRIEPKPIVFDPPPEPKKRVSFTKVVIKAPIWKVPRSVGILLDRITDNIQLEISYRGKDQRLLYPDPFYMSKKKALTYPQQGLKKNDKVKLVIIPLNDFETNPRNIDRIMEAP